MSNCHCDDHCSVDTFLSSLSFLQQQNNGKNLPNNNTPNKVPKYKQQWQTLSSTTTIQQQTNKQKDGRTKKRSKETMNDEPNIIQFHHDEKHSLFTEFNFHEYGKNGDAIYVHKSKRDNTYYTYLCDKAHFLIDDPELFVEVKEYNQKNPVLMVKESKIFSTPTIAYKQRRKRVQNYRNKKNLGELLFGIELLLKNHGINNFKHLLSLIENYFPATYESMTKKENQAILSEFDSLIDLYYDKTAPITPKPIELPSHAMTDNEETIEEEEELSAMIDKGTEIVVDIKENDNKEENNNTNVDQDININDQVENNNSNEHSCNNDCGHEQVISSTNNEDSSNNDQPYRKPKKRNQKLEHMKYKYLKDLVEKDKAGLTDTKYEIYHSSYEKSFTPISTIQDTRAIVNLQTALKMGLGVKQDPDIVFVNMITACQLLIEYDQLYVHEYLDQKFRQYLPHEDRVLVSKKKYWYRLNVDAFSDNNVTFSISLLNSKATKGPQSRKFVLPLAAWKGKEENFRKLGALFKFLIECMLVNGVKVNNEIYRVDFLLTTDLASLRYISNIRFKQMCPYCMCNATSCHRKHKIRTKKDLGCILGLDSSRIIICLLHMKERILERLLLDSIVKEHKPQACLKILKKIEGLQSFSISERRSSRKIFYKCYLTGNQCKALLANLSKIRPLMSKEYYDMFEKLKEIFHLLDNTTHFDNEKIEIIDSLIYKLKINYMLIYDRDASQSWYIHILIHHVVDLLKVYKGLILFSTHNFESAHIDDCENMMKTSKNGRSNSYLKRMFPDFKSTSIVQFMLKKWRLLYLCVEYGFIFDKMNKRDTSVVRKELSSSYPSVPAPNDDLSALVAQTSDSAVGNCEGCKAYCSSLVTETQTNAEMPNFSQSNSLPVQATQIGNRQSTMEETTNWMQSPTLINIEQ